MEASVRTSRTLEGDKAQRIVAAMRESVGLRGATGSTFDHVAQSAGVSRGLLHYYFGSKERLLAEVVRHDCEIRMEALEERLAGAGTPKRIVDVLVRQLEDFLEQDPGAYALVFEMFSASRHNEEIRLEMAELYRQVRGRVAEILRDKQEQGVVSPRADATAVAALLFAMADGVALQVLSDPDWDSRPAIRTGMEVAHFLLGGGE